MGLKINRIKMGFNLHNKLFSSLSTMILLIALTVSCLPVQKKTQCAASEAFNATSRQCVPVIGASTSNTVFIGSKSPQNSYSVSVSQSAPITHTVAVSDVYNYGFTVNWYVHAPGTTSTISVQENSASFAFYPALQAGAGQYIVEAILFDETGTNQLDSASWNVTIANQTSPSLISAYPAASAYSHLNTVTTPFNYAMNIYSPQLKGGTYYVYRDGTLVGNGSISTVSTLTAVDSTALAITPSSLTNGLHTLEVKIHDGLTSSDPEFDSYTWLINITDPQYPSVEPNGGNTIPVLSKTITVVDATPFETAGTFNWLYDDDDDSATAPAPLTQLCIQVDNSDKLAPAGKDIDVKFSIAGLEFEMDETAAGSNMFCAVTAELNLTQAKFNLTDPNISESRSLTVKTYVTGTLDVIEVLSWNIVIRPKNIRPIISIDAVNSNAAGCTPSASFPTTNYTGCTLTQSLNNNIDSNDTDYTDALDSTTVSASNFAFNIDYDPDITDDNDYSVVYQLRNIANGTWENVNLSGTNSDSSYSYSDCNYTSAQTTATTPTEIPSGNKKICALRIDAFNNDGPLASGSYELRAWIVDADGGMGTGSSPKESNILTWEITVAENQDVSSISIAAQTAATNLTYASIGEQAYYVDGVTSSNIKNESWLATTSGGDPITTIKENDDLYIHAVIRDTQRDDFNISVAIDNGVVGGQSSFIPTTVVNRVDHKEYSLVVLNAPIPEWVVSSSSTLVNLSVVVQDRPESYSGVCTTCATASANFSLTVENDNPIPVFTDFANVDLTTAAHQVIAGSPYTIPVLTSHFSDASLYDGANIKWKWQISTTTTATWTDIPNADSANQTSPSLVWTPNLEIASTEIINLRICLGDDGTNSIASSNTYSTPNVGSLTHNCSIADGSAEPYIKQWTNIKVVPAQKDLASTSTSPASGADLAQWYDETAKFLYTTYTSGTNIVVEKSAFNTSTNIFESIHSISFPTEDLQAGKSSVVATELSIDGIDSTSVMIAYKVIESSTTTPQLRVRRINTSRNKLAFHYCGMINTIDNAPHTTCTLNDLYDETATTLDDDVNATISSTTNGTMLISLTGVLTNGSQLVLKNNAGNPVTFTYNNGATNTGTDTVVYCSGTCTVDDSVTALANAINSKITDTDVDAISEEYFAVADTVADTVTIYGANELDSYDNEIKITPYIGNIQVSSAGNWFVPYVDVSFSNKISVATGVGAHQDLGLSSAATPSDTLIGSSGINNQEIHSQLVSGALYVVTKNSNANLDIYKLGDTAATLNTASSIQDVYSLSGFTSIENIKINVSESVTNNFVYVSSVNIANSGAVRKLGLNIFKPDLSAYKSSVEIPASGYSQYVENIDQAHVIADPNNLGVMYVALTTTNLNTNPNKAFMIKVKYSDTTAFSTSFDFHEFNYPQLNSSTDDTTLTTKISATSMPATMTIGHATAPLTSPVGIATADATLNPIFFAFHQAATGNTIKTGMYNTNQSSVMTNSTGVSGSYPAIIGN
jgi:hypothetical protein